MREKGKGQRGDIAGDSFSRGMPGNVRTRTEAALSLNARTAKTKRERGGG